MTPEPSESKSKAFPFAFSEHSRSEAVKDCLKRAGRRRLRTDSDTSAAMYQLALAIGLVQQQLDEDAESRRYWAENLVRVMEKLALRIAALESHAAFHT